MGYTIKEIADVIKGKAFLAEPATIIEQLLIDSRKLVFSSTTLFFALKTDRSNGANFIEELYKRGVRNFVVDDDFDRSNYLNANFIVTTNPLKSLQQLASFHRSKFNYPVLGITGSNGKTVVKEWLYQLLNQDYNIVRSPKSYNSQIGVPLSVWQMSEQHTLAIFEAGISQPGEMQILEEVIKPTIGIITNIGEAHSEGFKNIEEKAKEKALLFKNCKKIIYCKEATSPGLFPGNKDQYNDEVEFFTWSRIWSADLTIEKEETTQSSTIIIARKKSTQEHLTLSIPFLDRISVDNAISCYCVMIVLGYEQQEIEERIQHLSSIEMRMEVKKGVNSCTIINDSYSNDLSSLELALTYLKQQQGAKKLTAIVSDILQSGMSSSELISAIIVHAVVRSVNKLILIGPELFKERESDVVKLHTKKGLQTFFYLSTEAFLSELNTHQFRDEVILLKGARKFEFERISKLLEEKVHQTVMEIDLNAMVHNLKQYQMHLLPSTKIMAMVKAFSYGSGTAEVARVLQYNKVDYLAVAYADEGIELRKAGITMPIMVMNPETVTFDALVQYNLEPELYSFNILNAFHSYLLNEGIAAFPVHIKIDTGMHRLGFELNEIDELTRVFKLKNQLIIKSVFSHLVASEDENMDDFTNQQYNHFLQSCNTISNAIGYSFIKHLSNSAAIFRHPYLQCNMVRLGIGLYGVDINADSQLQLQPVATLTSTIAQLRKVKAGESVGYNRKGIIKEDSCIATIRLGYADGFSRRLSNGVGSVYVNGSFAPVIGNVCMDMTMIDITGIDAKEGDKVEIFGPNLPVQKVAEWAATIPYEIMTGISQRVKRVYYEE